MWGRVAFLGVPVSKSRLEELKVMFLELDSDGSGRTPQRVGVLCLLDVRSENLFGV